MLASLQTLCDAYRSAVSEYQNALADHRQGYLSKRELIAIKAKMLRQKSYLDAAVMAEKQPVA